MSVILGVDPGLAETGFGVVDASRSRLRMKECGCIRTKEGTPQGERLRVIHDEIGRLVRKHMPSSAVLEALFFAKNVTSAIPVAEARGVILLALAEHGIPVFEYSPPVIKKAIVGSGRAEKDQVQSMVRLLLRLDKLPETDHAADALAAALCHFQNLSLGGIPVFRGKAGVEAPAFKNAVRKKPGAKGSPKRPSASRKRKALP